MNGLGLIAAGLKGIGGAAQGVAEYAKGNIEQQRKIDYATQISKMDEEKLLRVDQIRRDRDLEYIPKTGDAETDVMVKREQRLRPEKAETAKSEAKGRSEGEIEGLKLYSLDDAARAGARAKASDARDPSTGINYQVLADGKIAVVRDGKTQGFLSDPTDPTKPLKGSTDLDKRTQALVQVLLAELKDVSTTDERRKEIPGEIRTLLGVTKTASPSPTPPAGDSGNKPWNKDYGNTSNITSP